MATSEESISQYRESQDNILTYIARLTYAIESATAKFFVQEVRYLDSERNIKYTNRYTIAELFPNENLIEAIKNELKSLSIQEYIITVRDLRYPKRSDMRVFGRAYDKGEVYIKFRVELLPDANVFVMSFHFASIKFEADDFPYKRIRGDKNENIK